MGSREVEGMAVASRSHRRCNPARSADAPRPFKPKVAGLDSLRAHFSPLRSLHPSLSLD